MFTFVRRYPISFVVLIGFILFFFGSNIANFYTDYLWYGEVGQRIVFTQMVGARALLFFLFGGLSFALAFINLRLAERFSPALGVRLNGVGGESGNTFLFDRQGRPTRVAAGSRTAQLLTGARRLLTILLTVGAVFLAIVSGLSAQIEWDSLLRFTHPVRFGSVDPQFGRDLGFYVFTLPFLHYIQSWLVVELLVVGIGVAVVYFFQKGIDTAAGRAFVAPHVRAHLSALAALLLSVIAWGYWLGRFDLLFGGGLVSGAGYTDVHVRLPMLNVLFAVTALVAFAVSVNIWRRSLRLPLAAVALYLVTTVLGFLIPAAVQVSVVKPNEGVRESPYITRSIVATRAAYGIEKVASESFPAEPNLTNAALRENRLTLDNIRLWDSEPLKETYPQQQGLRQYYGFPDVDVDRYHLGQRGDYRQVWLAAREIQPQGLDARAQTWPNLHLRYTHGYGVVMSPAGRFTSEGLPEFLLKDIPIVSDMAGLNVSQPRIYYGQGSATGTYVVVGTRQREFDYPLDTAGGASDQENQYDGAGGIKLSPLAKLAFAIRFQGWTNLLLSSDVNGNSRLLFARRVPDRVHRVAPFLRLDGDCYPIVANGRILWIQDGYTATGNYPYSAPVEQIDADGGTTRINYIRNSVKAVVDAYDGTVTLYAIDAADPILRGYQRIYPGLIHPLSEMPAPVKAHLRYPEDLFNIQRRILADYHVQDPNVFYARADSWQIAHASTTVEDAPAAPIAAGGDDPAVAPPSRMTSSDGTMPASYLMLRLPRQKQEEFLLLSPFAPRDRENMIALLAARCDGAHYGELVLYRFPASRIIYGPEQIAKRIRSDGKISPYLSLNDQKGSRVLFGSMLIVPIEKSLLYVQPLYVKAQTGATQGTSIPEIKKVIVAFENRIAMENTLPAALADLFGVGANDTAVPADSSTPAPVAGISRPVSGAKQLIEEASGEYDRAQTALKSGDFAAYGREIKALGTTLRALRGKPAANAAPAPNVPAVPLGGAAAR